MCRVLLKLRAIDQLRFMVFDPLLSGHEISWFIFNIETVKIL